MGRFFLSQAQDFIGQSSSPPVPIGKITIDRMEHGLQFEFVSKRQLRKRSRAGAQRLIQ
jgi:hypothetical protein